YGSYRMDGWGRAAFEPSMMVSLLLYAYARGERSSRGIERKCVEDVADRVIAIDGTKVHANASHHSNLDYEQLAKEILKEASEIDAAEDELYGEARGDELPEHLRTREGRRAALAEAKQKLEAERAENDSAKTEALDQAEAEPLGVKIELDPE